MCAAKVGAEEVIGIRYALRSLGVKLTRPTKMIGNNQGQLDSVSNPKRGIGNPEMEGLKKAVP
jgi:hypothetical protein